MYSEHLVTESCHYHPLILEALLGHGLMPGPSSPPGLLRDAVRDLYKYEIKRQRAALLAGRFPKPEYAGRIIELRRRYWVLSVPVHLWLRKTDS